MNAAPPGRLLWRSRRGTKELDLILQAWLEGRYARASRVERDLFAQFIELSDPEIAAYLLEKRTPRDPALAALVTQLVSP